MSGETEAVKNRVRIVRLTAHLLLLTVAPLGAQRHDALRYNISLTLPATDSFFTARVETR